MVEPVVLLDGRVTLYCGDCREILPTLGKVDAVVTDPPYGINADLGGGKSEAKWTAATGDARWDAAPIDDDLIADVIEAGRHAIVWGGNYYAMPRTSCWLVWDKETAGITSFADCEVAWTNLPRAMRLKRHLWSGPYQKVREIRHHPTQKPLDIMRWAIEQLPAKVELILDPFAGSGTTGVAAVQLGKRFIGIEREPVYFDVMRRRIEEASKQGDMFIEPAPAPKQETMAL